MKDPCWTLKLNKKKAVIALLILVFIPFLLIALKSPLCDGLARFLTIRDTLQPCDIIFVLGGKAERRVPYALGLFKEGQAQKLVLTLGKQDNWVEEAEKTLGLMPYDLSYVDKLLEKEKIDPNNCAILRGSYSTRDDALKLKKYYDGNKFNTALVVTDPIHSRRSLLCLHRAFKGTGVRFVSYPVPLEGFADKHTQRDDYINYVVEETLRYTFYLLGFKKHE